MKTESKAINGITEGVIWRQLLIFFFPILIGTFFQQLYNTADAVIVGRFVGKEALSAVGGPTGSLINLLIGFFLGLSTGASVIISQYYGANEEENVKHAVHTSIALSIAGGIIIMVLGILIAPYALRAMGTPKDIMQSSVIYITTFFLGTVFNLLYNMGSGILRAIGDSRRPLYFLIVSCGVNIVFDVLFVGILRLGVFGAALATILAQCISATLVMVVLIKSKACYRVSIKEIRFEPRILKQILKIGLPAGAQSMMYSLSNVIIQSGINGFGTDVVAAWTAYSKMDGFFWMTMSAFGISITTFVGQNFGAGLDKRVKKGIRICMTMAMSIATLLAVILYVGCPVLLQFFTTDKEVIRIGISMVKYFAPFYITYVTIEILSGSLKGVGDSFIPMIITALGICVLRVLWMFIVVPKHPHINTLMLSYPVSWVLTSIMFIIYLRYFSYLKNMFSRREFR